MCRALFRVVESKMERARERILCACSGSDVVLALWSSWFVSLNLAPANGSPGSSLFDGGTEHASQVQVKK